MFIHAKNLYNGWPTCSYTETFPGSVPLQVRHKCDDNQSHLDAPPCPDGIVCWGSNKRRYFSQYSASQESLCWCWLASESLFNLVFRCVAYLHIGPPLSHPLPHSLTKLQTNVTLDISREIVYILENIRQEITNSLDISIALLGLFKGRLQNINLHFCYAQFLKTTPQSQFQLNIGALSCAAVNSYDSVVGKTPACQQAASDLSQKKTTFASFVLMCLCTISQNYLRISRSSNCRV